MYLYMIICLTSIVSAGNDIISGATYRVAVMDSKIVRGEGKES